MLRQRLSAPQFTVALLLALLALPTAVHAQLLGKVLSIAGAVASPVTTVVPAVVNQLPIGSGAKQVLNAPATVINDATNKAIGAAGTAGGVAAGAAATIGQSVKDYVVAATKTALNTGNPLEVLHVGSPLFFQTVMAIKAGRQAGLITSEGQCKDIAKDASVAAALTAGLNGADPNTMQVINQFGSDAGDQACATAQAMMTRMSAAGGVPPSIPGTASAATLQTTFNLASTKPYPVSQCRAFASPYPFVILSTGQIVQWLPQPALGQMAWVLVGEMNISPDPRFSFLLNTVQGWFGIDPHGVILDLVSGAPRAQCI